MIAGCLRQAPPLPRARHEAQLQQVRLDHILERARILTHARGDRLDTGGAAAVHARERLHIRAVERIKPQGIDALELQRLVDGSQVKRAATAHLGEIAHTPQQPQGDARRAAAATGQAIQCALGNATHALQAGRAAQDLDEFRRAIEAQMVRDAEAIAQRLREQAWTRGRANERERLERHRHHARVHPAVDCEVDAEVLHRGIDVLLDRRGQAMDLVDEEHVTLFHLRERADEVRRLRQRRTARHVGTAAHLVGDHVRECGLAQPGRAVQQHVLHGSCAGTRGIDGDRKPLLQVRLPDVLRELLRTERRPGHGLGLAVATLLRRLDDSFSCHPWPPGIRT